MLTIAVANTKGGVGKTTLAATLAVRAAQDKFRGGSHYRVALVDLDPMKGLVAWWQRRGRTENPTIFEGCETAADAVERLEMDGWDICIMDSPPAFLTVIDEMIRKVSEHWRLERMPRVDRNILRLLVAEMLYLPDVPARVSINEAVELAKRFGAAESPAFVNGLLDSAIKALDVRK